MGLRPAVVGLVKHQLYIDHATFGQGVMTFWTYKAGAVVDARRTSEQLAIKAWLTSHWRQVTSASWSASMIKTWDFGTTPPTKLASEAVFPVIPGTLAIPQYLPPAMVAVIALRTEAVGSAVRDRHNGRLAHRGIHEVAAIGTLINPTAANLLTAYNALLTALKTATDANRGNWSIVSFKDDYAWRAVPVIKAVNHILIRSQAGVQRRSYLKAGPYARGA